ncbi:hypothetical protein Hanom_Chr07g00629611 [Helianthus anomalus]
MPEDLTDEKFALIANLDVYPDEFCFMALVSIQEGQESEDVNPSSEVIKIAETVVTIDIVSEQMLEEKKVEPLLEPLIDPWDASVCEGECDCAMMAAAKVSTQILKDLCLDKCIIAFANTKEVNENLRNKI